MSDKWDGKERRDHECVWKDKDTGEMMVPKMYGEKQVRDKWRYGMGIAMVGVLGVVMAQVGLVFAWASGIRNDIQDVNSSVKIMAKVQENHQFILQKYIGALMDARMESQKKIEYGGK